MTSLTFDADDFLHEQASPRRFDGVTIALHWLTVLLLIGLFASIWSLASVEDGEAAAFLLTLHRSLGVLLWITAIARIGWRLGRAFLPPFPVTMGAVQQWAARLSEYGLYALLLVQPLTGVAQSLARGKPFAIFGSDVPALMQRNRDLTHLFHELHENAAWLLLGLIALHVLAAIIHRVVARDEVLQSMLPWKQASAVKSHLFVEPGE